MKQSEGPFPKGKRVDMTGWTFGRLTVQRQVGNAPRGAPIWRCLCECGNTTDVMSSNLRNGGTQSCGCLYRETRGRARTSMGGLSEHPGYSAWRNMHSRCYDRDHPLYDLYGGRGVTVDPAWHGKAGLRAFIEEMYPKPLHLALVMRDWDLGFAPGNCYWGKRSEVPRHDQRLIAWKGKTRPLAKWPAHLDIDITAKALAARLDAGWTVEHAMTVPVGASQGGGLEKYLQSLEDPSVKIVRVPSGKPITWQGVTRPMKDWPAHLDIDISVSTLRGRLRSGWSVKDAFTIPVGVSHGMGHKLYLRHADDPGWQPSTRRTWGAITLNGDTKQLSEWAEITGISAGTIRSRLRRGWSPQLALTTPVRAK